MWIYDSETLASYARGIYDYYDAEQIEEFVAFKGAYEIEYLFEKYEAFDDDVYRPENLAILRYCMKIMNTITILMHLLRKFPLSKKWAHWMKKMMRGAKNKWRKSGWSPVPTL